MALKLTQPIKSVCENLGITEDSFVAAIKQRLSDAIKEQPKTQRYDLLAVILGEFGIASATISEILAEWGMEREPEPLETTEMAVCSMLGINHEDFVRNKPADGRRPVPDVETGSAKLTDADRAVCASLGIKEEDFAKNKPATQEQT